MAQRHRRPTHTRATICVIHRASRVSIKEKKKDESKYFFLVSRKQKFNRSAELLFFFPAITFDLKKKGGCHGDGMSESIPDDVFNISRRSKCQKWSTRRMVDLVSNTKEGRNHLRLPRSIDNKRITPGIYYTSTCSFLLYFFFAPDENWNLFWRQSSAKIPQKKMFLFSKEMWIDHARTDVHANHLPNDMFGQLSSPHNRKEKKKKKKLNAGIFASSQCAWVADTNEK